MEPLPDGAIMVLAAVGAAGSLVVAAALSAGARRAGLGMGLRRVVIAALALILIVAPLFFFASVGRPFLFTGALSVEGALGLGVMLAAVVAAGYLVVAAGSVALGLLLGLGRRWAELGWLLGPLAVAVVVALGAMAVSLATAEPAPRPGAAELVLQPSDGPPLSRRLDVGCVVTRSGELRVGNQEQAEDDQSIAIAVGPGGEVTSLHISVAGRHVVPGLGVEQAGRATVEAGSSVTRGKVRFEGLVPVDDDREPVGSLTWSGEVSWACR